MSITIKKIILLLLIPMGAQGACSDTEISQNNGTSNEKNRKCNTIKKFFSPRNNSPILAKTTTKTANPNTENEKPDPSIKTINNENHSEKENVDNIDTDSESDGENDDQPIKRRKKEGTKIWNRLKNLFKKKEKQEEDYED